MGYQPKHLNNGKAGKQPASAPPARHGSASAPARHGSTASTGKHRNGDKPGKHLAAKPGKHRSTGRRGKRVAGRRRFHPVSLLVILFAAGICVSGFMLVKHFFISKAEQNTFEQLAAFVSGAADTEKTELGAFFTELTGRVSEASATPESSEPVTETVSEAGTAEQELLARYAALQEENPDFYGWISIEDTKINYPVMYTPGDTEYYLHRGFDGTYSYSGVPFMDGECPADGSYCLVYGHNMQDGSMFRGLLSYAKKEFWEEHPVIRFDTLTELREYQVVAAIRTKVFNLEQSGVFRYYNYKDLPDEATFAEYFAQVQQEALYDTGIEAEFGDNILVLSTCAYHTSEGRFVVIAVEK